MKDVLILAALAAVGFTFVGCASDSGMSRQAADMSRQSPSVAEQACLAAVSNETDNGDVMILSSEYSEANSLVMVGVGEQRAPWRCLVSNDGVVAEVMFTGSEGAL